ncbi:uncharacterized protein LOC129188429 isoform X2 [Dunckerocampus dactyliophorus]|uniref:uncharacterized protein LOC129188429 isoform X2 n=1 Tax=Dunckerocampus dactyliophorus TaxID=161453 RepID=UPI0024061211|nr:uncharacterized protein LOC129188429 isoform X2 [Dunckerocampus dactyliophorus]
MDTDNRIMTLNDICCRAVSEHMDVLGTTAVLDLPTELLKDLLPHLDVCQLDELQPGLNLKGISTFSKWSKFCQLLTSTVNTCATEQDVKQEVMGRIFEMVINELYIPSIFGKHLNNPNVLLPAAKSINHFKLSCGPNTRIDLIAGQTPVLNVLEKTVTRFSLWIDKSVLRQKGKSLMYIIHRLMQHGVTKHIILRTDDKDILSKVLFEGGCLSRLHRENVWNEEEDEEEEEALKDAHFQMYPYIRYQNIHTCIGCPNRFIEHLELEDCSPKIFNQLTKILPLCSRLSALTLRSRSPIPVSDMLDFTKALEQLFQCSDASLRHLSIDPMSCPSLLSFLLSAYPRLTELNVNFGNFFMEELPLANNTSKLLLQRLSVKVCGQLTSPAFLLSLLRRCPHLVTLHLEGVHLPAPYSQKDLLTTLSESNGRLTSLHLMNLNLSDCFHQMLTMLRVCKLEELRLHSCHLLVQQSNKQEALRLLVDALKAVPSLRKLILTQNYFARDVHVLAELFTGPAPSSVEYLDLRHNLILPSGMLRFAEVLTTHPPPQRLTLDLTYNQGNNRYEWNAVVDKLRPFCQRVAYDWERPA